MIARVLVVLCLCAGIATAQAPLDPYADPAAALREANSAATSGDWERVETLVQPLLAKQLEKGDLAEAHRLAGIAALSVQPPRQQVAEQHFLAYLRLDLDGHLDPALYPPEVVTFFNDVRARHAAELRALRPKGKRYAVLTLVPPFGQFQNGERTKGWIIAGTLGAFAITNVTSNLLLRRWCTTVSHDGKSSRVCDEPVNHYDEAKTARSIQILSAVGFIATYVYGVWDGVRGYRRESRERALVPYVTPTETGGVAGIHMNF